MPTGPSRRPFAARSGEPGRGTRSWARSSARPGWGARSWIIDPIDGTKNYVRGVPVWATLISLMEYGQVKVGLVSAPALGKRWWAATDGGAWTGKSLTKATRMRVSSVPVWRTRRSPTPASAAGRRCGRLDNFLDLGRACWRTRAYGDFWSHMMVAEGSVEVSAEPELSPWDMAALTVIVEEAGGRWTDLAGVPGLEGGSLVCTNGILHDEVLRRLNGS